MTQCVGRIQGQGHIALSPLLPRSLSVSLKCLLSSIIIIIFDGSAESWEPCFLYYNLLELHLLPVCQREPHPVIPYASDFAITNVSVLLFV